MSDRNIDLTLCFNFCNVSQKKIPLLPSLLISSNLPFVSSPQNNKVRRFAFELKMQDKSTYLLAADSEVEMEDWINTLNKILHSSFEIAMQEKRNGEIHDGLWSDVPVPPYFFPARKGQTNVKLIINYSTSYISCKTIFWQPEICLLCFIISIKYYYYYWYTSIYICNVRSG